jgi:Tol biopolymer transport system component
LGQESSGKKVNRTRFKEIFMAPLLKSVERMEVTREIMWVLVGMLVLFGSSCEKKLPVVDYSLYRSERYADMAVFRSDDGDTLLAYYFNGAGDPFKSGIYLYDVNQGEEKVLALEVSAEGIDFSPDGQWLVLSVNHAIWKTTLDFDTPILLASDDQGGYCCYPDWSPDGQKIAYDIDGGPNRGIWIMGPDGQNQERLVWLARDPTWSPDGSKLYYENYTDTTSSDTISLEIYSYDLATGREKRLTYLHREYCRAAALSPSESLLAFVVDERGRLPELWIMSRDGEDPHRIAYDGDNPVFYSEQEILYTKVTWGDGRLWLVRSDGQNSRPFLGE